MNWGLFGFKKKEKKKKENGISFEGFLCLIYHGVIWLHTQFDEYTHDVHWRRLDGHGNQSHAKTNRGGIFIFIFLWR